MFLSRDRTSIRHEDVNKQSAVLFDRYAIQLLCCQLRKSTNECVQQTFLSFSVEYEQAGKTEGLDWQRSTQALGAERRNSNMQWSLYKWSVASILLHCKQKRFTLKVYLGFPGFSVQKTLVEGLQMVLWGMGFLANLSLRLHIEHNQFLHAHAH